ncbi:MAG: addiction module protein [Planctomycetota bacterium]|nr:addiction module protein [Planctomycetota bacterium]
MTSQYAEISRSALALPKPKRARLAKRLIDSLDRASQREVDQAWAVEIARRVRELDEGKVKTIPGKRAMRELRARLRG